MVKISRSLSAISAVVFALSCSCGDIIKARNPLKDPHHPEPDYKYADGIGKCANFDGRWHINCAENNTALTESNLLLSQNNCTLIQFIGQERSFTSFSVSNTETESLPIERRLAWEDQNLKLTLSEIRNDGRKVSKETFILQKSGDSMSGKYELKESTEESSEKVSAQCELQFLGR